ncbi:hypothetical protein ACZ87_02359 [Candidatus Erwinia dacicola]|uniref:Uncharacterized protein n=1 Tax=Candidatus Erwinia dacicola TaxID=252393 RepID=A0A328TK33_9GAMM|nr:hypothetical protein ACZ87_02359 [Candidatus Erwinia dacicola]
MLIYLQKSNINHLLIYAAIKSLLQRFSLHFQTFSDIFGDHTATSIKKTAYLPQSNPPSGLWK